MNRRGFLGSILAAGMAPVIVKAEILMPVRQIWVPSSVPAFVPRNNLITAEEVARQSLKILRERLNFTASLNRGWSRSWALEVSEH